MPTSSQNLILQKKIHGVSISGRSSQCMFRDPAQCHVAAVYNLGGCMPLSGNSVPDHDAVHILGRESAQLFKYHSLPRGLTSILALDKLSGLLQWQAIGGEEGQSKIQPQASESMIERRCQSELATKAPEKARQRPQSAVPAQSSKVHVDPLVFDSLIQLGFSKSALMKREDCVFDGISGRRAVIPKCWGKTVRTETASCTSGLLSESKPDAIVEVKEGDKKEPEDELLDLNSDDGDSTEEFNRIKPSMYMRSDVPDARPRAAIFSFRDNEFSTHAEVKYLIETQIGIRVKSIQFDPLDVRSAKPGVHSRWIVDFFSDWDLHVVLKKGLIVGKDKLLFYKHDEIAKREVSSFKYYMTVQEAKKKLKGKSLSNRRSSAMIHSKIAAKSTKSLS